MRNSKRRLGMLAIPAVLAIPIALLSDIDAIGGQEAMSLEKAGIIQKIQSMDQSKVNSIQPEGTPVQIKKAAAREISKGSFRRLTGASPRYRVMSTYPDITLINVSERTISSFIIAVKSRADDTGGGHSVWTKGLSISPGSSFRLASSKWTRAERVFVQKDGNFKPALRQPGLDSSESWLPGAASDLIVVIAMVEFADGTRWKVPADLTW